jgi:hypothetical protein
MSLRTFGADSPASLAQFRSGAGTNNAYPQVGPIVFSEIMYRPVDFPGSVDNVRDEFIELYNAASSAVALYDPANPANTWRLRGGADFDFPTNISMPAGSYLLVVSFDPVNDTNSLAAFRAAYPQLPANAALYGPYIGKLANNGESVNLEKPGTPVAGYVPHILVEHVKYNQAAPWDVLADGTGYALQRAYEDEYANDPASWFAAAPSPGTAYVPSTDVDGDGIPDAWEQQYFGHASGLVADLSRATDDADGDGSSNLQEYLAGTNPRDPSSTLRLSLTAPQPGRQVSLTLSLPADHGFTVLSSPTLAGAAWNPLTNYPAAPTNRVFQLIIPGSSASGFYRLRTP